MSGQPEGPVETVRKWLRYAEEDLGVAGREFERGSTAFHTICFLCQAAAEKCLKAYLIAHGWQLERTHDAVALLELCAAHDATWRELLDDGALLNEYIVSGRYPGDLAFEEIGRPEAEEALGAVRRIHARVTALFKRSPTDAG
jgi:HEPN domain-containing protein